MKKGKGRVFWLVISIIAIVLIVWIGSRILSNGVEKIKVVSVARGSIEQVINASGVVDAPVYELGSKLGGRIVSWKVKEGGYVRTGQLLATFDNFEQARNDFDRTARLYEQGAASKQSYDAAKTFFDSARIISPNSGVVAKINFDEGETVVPGQPAVTIVNYERSWINAQIDEIDIANVKLGDRVKITTDVYPDKIYEGEIYWIAPLAELRKVGGRVKMDEESYVFPCKIKFLGAHDELKVNMSVNVDVSARHSDKALIVPREALISRDEETYVFIVGKNKRVQESKIEIGIRSYSSVEATSGVNENDLIAVSNVNKLKDKGRIKIEQ